MKSQFRGFTLIELMVTVAIIGILAAVALPAYSDYIRRGQLPEATAQLSNLRIKMEQYYQDNRNYGSGSSCATSTIFASTKYFSYSCTTDGQTFTITADGIKGQAVGNTYTIDDTGAQVTTKFKGSGGLTRTCWLIKGDEC